jgi:O-antigen/teichoic acid export membrane protein
MTTDLNKIGIFSNIFVNFTAKILKALVFFLLTILVARGFGPEGKGIITLFIFLPELMYFMLHFGLGNANIYFISGGQENERKIFNNTF